MCFKYLICLLNISVLLHNKYAAVPHLAEGQLLRVTEIWVKFLVLQEGTLRPILSIKGQN
jgi:hypothetical protein